MPRTISIRFKNTKADQAFARHLLELERQKAGYTPRNQGLEMSNEQRLQQQIINLTHEVKSLNLSLIELTTLLVHTEEDNPGFLTDQMGLLERLMNDLGKQSGRLSSINPPERR